MGLLDYLDEQPTPRKWMTFLCEEDDHKACYGVVVEGPGDGVMQRVCQCDCHKKCTRCGGLLQQVHGQDALWSCTVCHKKFNFEPQGT